MSLFTKATRAQTKLRLALTGPAGSGKTMSALKIARGLVGPKGRIAVIDTENGSASYYSSLFEFDTAQMTPPYLITKYTGAITEAAKAGYDCVIIDSLSHAWSGEGGILQRKEQLDARGGNGFANWAKMTPEQNSLVNAVLHSTTNVICTMRTKMEYALEQNEKGKAAPKKIGLAPVQREGFEYEFDIVLDVDVDTHTAKASKDRTGLFVERIFQVEERHGALIAEWQKGGKPPEPPKKPQDPATQTTAPSTPPPASTPAKQEPPPQQDPRDKVITDAQLKRLFAIITSQVNKGAWTEEEAKDYIYTMGNVTSTRDLKQSDYDKICSFIEAGNEVKF